MEIGTKNILIICYGFPPSPGVAGRRWAKFAKYLKRNGNNVFVLASKNSKKSQSEWNNDIKGIDVEYLPSYFPKVMTSNNQNVLDKIQYRFWLIILKIINRGNFYDRSFFWKNQIKRKVKQYVYSKNIDTVIVTAGPFILSYYVTRLKRTLPHVKFIVDFRDLWTSDSEITSFSALSEDRVKFERKFEKRTIDQADYIFTVGEKMSDYFKDLSVNKKILTIPNGYDEDDFSDVEISDHAKSLNDEIRLVFAGTLYINLNYILIPFFEAIIKVKENFPELYERIRFQFYGTFPVSYKELIKRYNIDDRFTINESISLKEIYSKIKNSTACLLFLNDVYNFALSTKFCEYVSQNKKIIVVSNNGPTANFITSNKLGYWISPKNSYKDFLECLKTLSNSVHEKETSQFDISVYSVENIVKNVIDVINKPLERTQAIKQTKNVLFTFDYELFLGKDSGSAYNSILKPTEIVLKSLEKIGIKNALFFIDTLYLYRLSAIKNSSAQNDYSQICNQLTQILKDGHFIYPHIHTHWYNATYNSLFNQWNLDDLSLYRFHSISKEKQEESFEFSISFIKAIQNRAKVYYDIDCYRAGGWCIQPFKDFKPFFVKYGIKYDFSVLKDFRLNHNESFYNFEGFPKSYVYNFEDDISLESYNGKFKEFSITSINYSKAKIVFNSIFLKFAYRLNYVNFGDGISAQRNDSSEEIGSPKKIDFGKSIEMTSIELMTAVKLNDYKKFLGSNNFMHFISHPKMISKHHIYCFEKFLKYSLNNFNIETDFKNM
ncbi:MAG: glycosyltransferase [Bacteroidota bacterium]|nr:glycosyltransferase [Bacteroidota bacterium]